MSGFFIAIRPTPTTITTFRTWSFGSGFGVEDHPSFVPLRAQFLRNELIYLLSNEGDRRLAYG